MSRSAFVKSGRLEYKIYDRPKKVSLDDIRTKFPDGGVLIHNTNLTHMYVRAYIKLTDDATMTVGEYVEEFKDASGFDMEKYDCKAFMVQRLVKSNINVETPRVYSVEKFYNEFAKKLQQDVANLCKAYKLLEENIFIFYLENADFGTISYYGFSCEPDMEELEKVLPHNAVAIDCDAFKAHCDLMRDYLKSERRKLFGSSSGKMSENQNTKSDVDRGPRCNVAAWLKGNPFPQFLAYLKNRVKGQEELDIIAAAVYKYLDNIANDRPANTRILLSAPSGCGKTETYRAIKDYFAKEVPLLKVIQSDLSMITENGFKGPDVIDIVKPLMTDKSEGVGIVFMDEFDKKLAPSYTSQGTDVNASVQGELLTMVEGSIVRDKDKSIDTSNTLFIGMGAFDSLREKKSFVPKKLGFGEADMSEVRNHYAKITKADMVEFGGCNELIGRFNIVAAYHELTKEAIDEIIDGLVDKLSINYDFTVEIGDKMREKLREHANSKFGCRELSSMLEEEAMAAYMEALKGGMNSSQVLLKIEDVGIRSLTVLPEEETFD